MREKHRAKGKQILNRHIAFQRGCKGDPSAFKKRRFFTRQWDFPAHYSSDTL